MGGGEERKGRAKMWAFGGEGKAGGGIVAGGGGYLLADGDAPW